MLTELCQAQDRDPLFSRAMQKAGFSNVQSSVLGKEAPAQMLLFTISAQDTGALPHTKPPSATIRVYQHGLFCAFAGSFTR